MRVVRSDFDSIFVPHEGNLGRPCVTRDDSGDEDVAFIVSCV